MREKVKEIIVWFLGVLVAFMVGIGTAGGITALWEIQQLKSELTSLQFDYYSSALKELNKEVGNGRNNP